MQKITKILFSYTFTSFLITKTFKKQKKTFKTLLHLWSEHLPLKSQLHPGAECLPSLDTGICLTQYGAHTEDYVNGRTADTLWALDYRLFGG